MRINEWTGLAWLVALCVLPACGDTEDTTDPNPGGSGGAGAAGAGGPGTAGAQNLAGAGGSGAPQLMPLMGSACLPSAELDPQFAGFAASDVTVEQGSPYCAANAVCLVDHFQGRVSCPYGQAADGEQGCSVPGGEQRVGASVEPQRLDRRAEDAVYCSCRCDGPDPTAEYCQCEAGFECQERVPALVSGQNLEHVGSYCVRSADARPNPVALSAATCEAGSGECGTEPGLPTSLPVLAPDAPLPSTTISPFLLAPAAARKLDLLFMVDNSAGMAQSQELLARSVRELLEHLANPLCVDAAGNVQPPPAAGGACPAGQVRQFEPFTDLHVGFITSSLGDAGANVACPASPGDSPAFVPDRNDRGHLLGSLARGQSLGASAQGFLEWRAGEAGFADFTASAQRMLRAVGENGCGWEQSLEAWYRFLVDPAPYRGLTRVVCPNSASTQANCVQPEVDADSRVLLDEELLAQRAAFLRPDSTVAIVMLSDENDCSMQNALQSWVVLDIADTRPFFRGSSACEQDANDKCCYNCQLTPPDGCAVDPACTDDNPNPNRLAPEQDGRNLRCFEQKRRFGFDFLNPTQRYVNALTQPELCIDALDLAAEGCGPGQLRPNPLYEGGRSRSQIVLGGLLGVPWQSLASSVSASGEPQPASALRYKSAAELSAQGDPTWSQVLGSPGVPWRPATETQPEVASVPRTLPTLPQMVESERPRPAVTPGNALNGRDYDTRSIASPEGTPDDLQYACIFPLAQPVNCAEQDPLTSFCDCFPGYNDSPLCELTPGVSPPGTLQYWAGASPALRQLQVLKELGESSVVSSICARNVADASSGDYGYRPAIGALLEHFQASAP